MPTLIVWSKGASGSERPQRSRGWFTNGSMQRVRSEGASGIERPQGSLTLCLAYDTRACSGDGRGYSGHTSIIK